MKKSVGNPYTAHKQPRRGPVKKRFVPKTASRADRQLFRYRDLMEDFYRLGDELVGRTGLLALPGNGCAHSTEIFRPVHTEPNWKSRPLFVALSVGRGASGELKLRLCGAESKFDPKSGLLRYRNGDGRDQLCSFDFTMEPHPGAYGNVLDADAEHVLFTAANNCLQTLLESCGKPTQSLALPRLLVVIEGDKSPVDYKKLEAIVADVPESMRGQYRKALLAGAEVVSCGTRFIDARLLPDGELRRAFVQRRAWEDFGELLGVDMPNPARKMLRPSNPARRVLRDFPTFNGRPVAGFKFVAENSVEVSFFDQENSTTVSAEDWKRFCVAGLPSGWAAAAPEALYERLMGDMRQCLPLPEMALDSDLLDALAEPDQPIQFSVSFETVLGQEPAAVSRAMLNTFPKGASVRNHVQEHELLAAARAPELPLRVGSYSKIQVVETASFNKLPNHSTGSFWPTESDIVRNQAPVWSEELDGMELEEGDVAERPVPCIQAAREKIAE